MKILQNTDSLLVLVNKSRRLPISYEPNDLIGLDGIIITTKKGLKLRAESAKHIRKMNIAAKKENINLIVSSAYRSFSTQKSTFESWEKNKGLKIASMISAKPGHSQHQLGTTVDITSIEVLLGFSTKFEGTREDKWLKKNAYKYGFVLSYPKGKESITGYVFEPWHYRYIGILNAKKMKDSKMILEQFLSNFDVK